MKQAMKEVLEHVGIFVFSLFRDEKPMDGY